MKSGAPGKPLSWRLSNAIDLGRRKTQKRMINVTLDIKGDLCSWKIHNQMCFWRAGTWMLDAK